MAFLSRSISAKPAGMLHLLAFERRDCQLVRLDSALVRVDGPLVLVFPCSKIRVALVESFLMRGKHRTNNVVLAIQFNAPGLQVLKLRNRGVGFVAGLL
jgi:hypothetical protein